MSTQITTHHPVRTDLPPSTQTTGRTDRQDDAADANATKPASRAWAVAGIGAAVTALGSGVSAGLVGAVYDPAISDDAGAVLTTLGDYVPHMIAFQVLGSVSALLLAVFGIGLYRRLAPTSGPQSLAPALGAFGLLATAVVLVMGTSLNTEFAFGVAADGLLVPEAAVVYNHWIGTVPNCWLLVGLSALAVWVGARRGDVPRWLGRVGLGFGAPTLLVGILPVQYMAGMTGALWLLVTALGFTFGDKAARRA